jgi:hypothetical protein
MKKLNWIRDPLMDSLEANTEYGTYFCVRDYLDVSILSFNDEELIRSSVGSHEKSKIYAEIHYNKMIEEDTDMFIHEGSLKAFKKYKKMLEDKSIKSQEDLENPVSLEHIHFMCDTCIKALTDKKSEMSVDKFSRWLGYVQAVLIYKKLTSLDAERNNTREWLK